MSSFERIYFSRGTTPTFTPNGRRSAAPCSTRGQGHRQRLYQQRLQLHPEHRRGGLLRAARSGPHAPAHGGQGAILKARTEGRLTEELLDQLIRTIWPRSAKIAHKDIKLRTFISQEKGRAHLVFSHVYEHHLRGGPAEGQPSSDRRFDRARDEPEGSRSSKILSRTEPKKDRLIASTAPQIRYPDCYGIDMSELAKFHRLQRAAVELVREDGASNLLQEIYQDCVAQGKRPRPPEMGQPTSPRIYKRIQATSRWRPRSPSWSTRVTCLGRES